MTTREDKINALRRLYPANSFKDWDDKDIDKLYSEWEKARDSTYWSHDKLGNVHYSNVNPTRSKSYNKNNMRKFLNTGR